MGKNKKLIEIKKDLQTIKKKNMEKLVGGKKGKRKGWNTCGGIFPQ